MALLNYQNYPISSKPLPFNVKEATFDSLRSFGFNPETMILENYKIPGRGKTSLSLNALAFTHEINRTLDYTGLTVFSPISGLEENRVVEELFQSAAPFHLMYRDGKETFSLWFNNLKRGTDPEPQLIWSDVHYTNLKGALSDYEDDINPHRITEVKQGLNVFSHERFLKKEGYQLALWATDVTSDLLVEQFGSAVNFLKSFRNAKNGSLIPTNDVTDLSTQLLGAVILAQTGGLGETIRRTEPSLGEVINAAHLKFPAYFNFELFMHWNRAAEEAYSLLQQVRFSGFYPDMLKNLFIEAFPDPSVRKELGRYDTPLYLTRRIWNTIPIEFLRPGNRITADMTCGWGSFLIAGYERFSRMPDMDYREFRKNLHGNDTEYFTSRLAALNLLVSTSQDSWHIESKNAEEWRWIEEHHPNIIVGNPPFLANRKTIRGKEKRYQKADIYLGRAINHLAEDGYLAMVMPQSFLTSQDSVTARKELLSKCDILELWELPLEVFQDARASTVVVFAQKKQEQKLLPVRVRSIHERALNSYKDRGIFTASGIVINQKAWENAPQEQGKPPFAFDYQIVLPEFSWRKIRACCENLDKVAYVMMGAVVGEKLEEKSWKDYGNPEEVPWLSGADVLPSPFVIDESLASTIIYPNDLVRPGKYKRYPNNPQKGKEHLFRSEKVLLISNPHQSWGKRVKVAIDRKGYFVSNNFYMVKLLPNSNRPFLTNEVIAAILDWYISNAWVVENLRSTWVNKRIVRSIPIPTELDREACNELTRLVRSNEKAIKATGEPLGDVSTRIDRILQKAYHLDDSTFERTKLLSSWDQHENLSIDDYPSTDARWKTSGVVQYVNAEEGLITLWLGDFDEPQTVKFSSLMPGWLLRTGAAFHTTIPRHCIKEQTLRNVTWGNFFPQDYSYMSEEELYEDVVNLLNSELNGNE